MSYFLNKILTLYSSNILLFKREDFRCVGFVLLSELYKINQNFFINHFERFILETSGSYILVNEGSKIA